MGGRLLEAGGRDAVLSEVEGRIVEMVVVGGRKLAAGGRDADVRGGGPWVVEVGGRKLEAGGRGVEMVKVGSR